MIKGAANKSALGVLVERTTRLVMLAKLPDATADSVLAAFTYKLNQVAAPLRQSCTLNRHGNRGGQFVYAWPAPWWLDWRVADSSFPRPLWTAFGS